MAGTIFGIFDADEGCVICDEDLYGDPEECGDLMGQASQQCLRTTLQPGSSLVASGYCLYSSSTFFCLTLGAGNPLPEPEPWPSTPETTI